MVGKASDTFPTPVEKVVVGVEKGVGADGSLLPHVMPIASSAFKAATPPRKSARTSFTITALSYADRPSPTRPMRATVSAVHASCDDKAASANEAMVDSGRAWGLKGGMCNECKNAR